MQRTKEDDLYTCTIHFIYVHLGCKRFTNIFLRYVTYALRLLRFVRERTLNPSNVFSGPGEEQVSLRGGREPQTTSGNNDPQPTAAAAAAATTATAV